MRLFEISVGGRDPELVHDRCWQAGAAGLWDLDDRVRVGVEDHDVDRFVRATRDLDPVDVTEVEAVELTGRSIELEIAGRRVEAWVPPTVFGDGAHPTTRDCLALIEGRMHPGERVLDVGCGAGLLSISAAVQGAAVAAIDIDPAAVAATADNAARNGVAIDASAMPVAEVVGPFDWVLANLTVGELSPVVPELLRCAGPDGRIVVSGVLTEQWTQVLAMLDRPVEAEIRTDGWVSARLGPTRPARG